MARRASSGSVAQIGGSEAHVVRDGGRQIVPASELVPGDMVLLEAGNFVPADIRLVEAINLRIEEAALTGESVPCRETLLPCSSQISRLGIGRTRRLWGPW